MGTFSIEMPCSTSVTTRNKFVSFVVCIYSIVFSLAIIEINCTFVVCVHGENVVAFLIQITDLACLVIAIYALRVKFRLWSSMSSILLFSGSCILLCMIYQCKTIMDNG